LGTLGSPYSAGHSKYWVIFKSFGGKLRTALPTSLILEQSDPTAICLPGCLPRSYFCARKIAEIPAAWAQLQKSSDLTPKADIRGRYGDTSPAKPAR
jgi:hypothetical protein